MKPLDYLIQTLALDQKLTEDEIELFLMAELKMTTSTLAEDIAHHYVR
jgi:hypothetical protein